MITIKNKKLLSLLLEKDKLVKEGRAISVAMEGVEKEIAKCEEKERKITAKVQPKELGEEADALKVKIDDLIKEFEVKANAITKMKLDAIPKDLEKKHRDLMELREKKERERNKIALKIQKIKDRAIPIIHKAVLPKLKEFEDIGTADVNGEVVEVQTFSHLEEWKKAFAAKKKVTTE